MSNSARPSTTTVRYEFRPYSYEEVNRLLTKVRAEFGQPKRRGRWNFETARTADTESNLWVVDFNFQDPDDALMFSLKYLR